MISDLITSWIRTAVPIAIGAALTWIFTHFNVVLSDDQAATVTAASVAIVTAAYYTLARGLEAKWPQLGILLGATRQPSYQLTSGGEPADGLAYDRAAYDDTDQDPVDEPGSYVPSDEQDNMR